MPRITGKDAIKAAVKEYGGTGVGFFSLKGDGDKETVRFLHEDDKDLEIYVVHKMEVDGKSVYVECLQDETCPLCASGSTPSVKVFFALYVASEDKVLIWDRGPGIIDQILGLIDKYGFMNTRTYEIQRHGKPGDTKTNYQLFPEDKSDPVDVKGKPLEKRPDILGRFVQQWSAEEIQAKLASADAAADRRDRKEGSKKGPGF